MSVVDEVKDRIDPVGLIGQTVKLRKTGKNYTGFCPFHPNTRTPAFVLFPETGTWRCFGACNDGGDIFSFVMKKEGWDFRETLTFLADQAGVELEPQTPERKAEQETHERLRELLGASASFYRHNLINTPAGEPVLEYLRGRGLSDAIMETFELGYAPKSWDAGLNFLLERGFKEEEALQAGVVSERESGGVYDRFRHRIMFPIRDSRGRMTGFGARIVDPEDVPKFLNSPQTVLFDKSSLLYGLDKARKAIRASDLAVIVEGYLDVVALHQADFGNAVSPMGTAITDHHLRQLKRFSRRMILAMDADAAGLQATMRGLSTARESLDRESDPVFNARGLVGYEGRLDADIRIITLPDGLDPDEVVVDDPAKWPELLSGAQTIVDYVLDTLTHSQNVADPKVKAEIARQVIPLIEDVSDPVERETYRQGLARRLKVDERALLNWRPRAARRRTSRSEGSEVQPVAELGRLARTTSAVSERFCLAVLLRDPEFLYRIDRELQSLNLGRLDEQDFTGSDHRLVFQTVRAALRQEQDEPSEYWRAALQEPLLQEAHTMAAEMGDLDTQQPKTVDDLLSGFLRLRKRVQDERFEHLHFELNSAQEEVEADNQDSESQIEVLTREVLELAQKRARLEGAIARYHGALHNHAAERR